MGNKLNNAVTDNLVTDKPKTTWFFAYNYQTANSHGTGNFVVEIDGTLNFTDIQNLEKDIVQRMYKGQASVVVTNFIKLEGE